MIAPIFILFKPQLGENIGAVARAMSNFGLVDLRLVAPRDGWPNEAAEAMAAGGLGIIQQATLFATLADALHDITHLYATTARTRSLGKPVWTPRELMENSPPRRRGGGDAAGVEGGVSHQSPDTCPPLGSSAASPPPPAGGAKMAILFGPERAGLANEEIALADGVVTIPVSAENPSLNLAQSSVVLGYEWFASQSLPLPDAQKNPALVTGEPREDIATKQELEGFLDHLKPLLEEINYFREPNKTEQMWLNLRHIFNRMQPSQQELRTLRGVLRSLLRNLRKG